MTLSISLWIELFLPVTAINFVLLNGILLLYGIPFDRLPQIDINFIVGLAFLYSAGQTGNMMLDFDNWKKHLLLQVIIFMEASWIGFDMPLGTQVKIFISVFSIPKAILLILEKVEDMIEDWNDPLPVLADELRERISNSLSDIFKIKGIRGLIAQFASADSFNEKIYSIPNIFYSNLRHTYRRIAFVIPGSDFPRENGFYVVGFNKSQTSSFFFGLIYTVNEVKLGFDIYGYRGSGDSRNYPKIQNKAMLVDMTIWLKENKVFIQYTLECDGNRASDSIEYQSKRVHSFTLQFDFAKQGACSAWDPDQMIESTLDF